MKLEVLDYIRDNNDNFYIVKQILEMKLYGEKVYEVSEEGRYNHLTRKKYKKVINENGEMELITNIKETYKARTFYKENKHKLKDNWRLFVDTLNEIGIKDKDIGIFGSYLIGFEINKDVDYIIYGVNNYKKYIKNINYIKEKLKVTSISEDHIKYQVNKYSKLYSGKNDFEKIIRHNHAGLQYKKGVLSTVRFIKKTKHYDKFEGKEQIMDAIVIDGEGTNFIPRIGIVKVNDNKIKVITYFWMFNAFLKKNEKVKIKGIYNQKKQELYLTNKDHYIKYEV